MNACLNKIAYLSAAMTVLSVNLPSHSPAAGWTTVSAMSAPAWDGHVLRLQSGQGTLAVTPLSDDVIRVRFTAAPTFGRDHSYAVLTRDLGPVQVQTDIKPDAATLTTASLNVTVQYSPLRISFANMAGEILDADDPVRGLSLAGSEFRVAKQLRDDEHVYGFGEKTGRLDKRGWQLGGYNYVMWNSDTPAYDSSTDPLYVDVPFFLVTRRGQAHGIFLDNTWRSFFDVGREQPCLLTFGADGGDLDYYFINGPDPKQVLERYTALTGRMPLPPLWSLGFNQCRWSYYPESRVRLLADTFRGKKVPADALWLDIHCFPAMNAPPRLTTNSCSAPTCSWLPCCGRVWTGATFICRPAIGSITGPDVITPAMPPFTCRSRWIPFRCLCVAADSFSASRSSNIPARCPASPCACSWRRPPNPPRPSTKTTAKASTIAKADS